MPATLSPRAPGSLHGLSAVVTGGSRGLGLLIADQLVRRGCTVTLAARDTAELERAAELLQQRHPGAPVRTAVTDVRDKEDVAELLRRTAAACGGVDVVVANAGIIQVAPAEAVGAAGFESAMSTIFDGALHTGLEALPYLRESRAGGRLALIGSVGGLLAVPHLLPYSCAKAAVGALAEGLHVEAARDGVSVTAVHPGLMRTGSHLHAVFGGDRRREFAWFSALAGTPLVSMDAQRAADRIVTAVQRRRVRLVLTPAARAADKAHGLAPVLTARLSHVVNTLLPSPDGEPELRPGIDVEPDRPRTFGERLRSLGSALNDRADRAYNERHHTAQERAHP
ncbi:SDR family oxidoreductase [Streptomyces kunmingensis]|uniref:SDR family oxidoreductase n=1 Tax=Streptomyces kunmingensis TaxID=68225 RepID=A0ABU6CAC4_9ACTN|nr:SDR family oxidoreductase [Streptomyces kunmingensis]MEB3961588.1 SDR family oxidoreductase [Streptomyces kunmingensis]